MSNKGHKVLLGFEDESITDKHISCVNFTTNKIGGKPDWPVEGIPHPHCQLCGLRLPLVLQIYAPLANSPYHRTLYLFGCINRNCWNQNDSWMCIRSQVLDNAVASTTATSDTAVSTTASTDWCSDAADWDEDNNGNNNEENGNTIENNFSDDEDETEDYDEIQKQFGNLNMDEHDANWRVMAAAGAQCGGAVGSLYSPAATAEIEGDESEVVSIDTPTVSQHNLAALLQEIAPLSVELHDKDGNKQHYILCSRITQFAPTFISAQEEELPKQSPTVTSISEHVLDLLQEYQQNHEEDMNLLSPQQAQNQGKQETLETYEKGIPRHGDKMFHHFITRIQHNPGQVLRYYSEGGAPLLMYPLQDFPTKCVHCNGKLILELQILPTLIPKLHLYGTEGEGVHIEFGTVLIFTCHQSCWSGGDTWKQETVVVQAERI